MDIKKQPVIVNFQKGLDTKTDPFQVAAGNFSALSNSVFDSLGRLTKRNGFGTITSNPGNSATTLATFYQDLMAIGSTVSSYDSQLGAWYSKGAYQALTLSTVGAVRNNFNQVFCDSATATNLSCVVYCQVVGSPLFSLGTAYYSIIDSTTGQVVANAPVVALTAGVPVVRVFYLAPYFILVFQNGSGQIDYQAINATTLVAGSVTNISMDAASPLGQAFDGVVAGTSLYLSWTNNAGNKVRINSLSNALVLGAGADGDASRGGAVMGMCADTSGGSPILWTVYSVVGTTTSVRAFSFSTALVVQTTSTAVITTDSTLNVTGYATAGVLNALAENGTTKGYDTLIPNSEIRSNTLTPTTVGSPGTPGSQKILNYQLGLGSKAFFLGSSPCVWSAWQSPYQNGYFLLKLTTTTAVGIGKISYQDGGGYLPYGLPSVSISGSNYYFPYLFKDLVVAVNKETNINSTATNPIGPGGTYAQLGVNLATFSVPSYVTPVEINANLVISGGFVWACDGVVTTEQNFFLYPELITNPNNTSSFNISGYGGIGQDATSVTPGVTTHSGSKIAELDDYTSVFPGELIVAAGIPTNTYITAVKATGPGAGIQMTNAATASASVSSTITANVDKQTYFYQFIYQWADNKGNIHSSAPSIPIEVEVSADDARVTIKVPTLPLTYKSNVKILGFRWSEAQQEYFQFTRVDQPTLNDTTTTYVTIVDTYSDAQILGNSLIYTTGNVVEDISPPPSDIITLFDSRAWVLDSEDRNLWRYSKQAIEGVPLEMSDLLTYYVPPIIGGQGNLGPVTAGFPLDDKLIMFRANAIQYINGAGPDNTGANNQYSQPIFITSPVGCANQRSIVQTPQGLMFQSSQGIWLLDRNMQVSYIGAEVEIYNQYTVTSAVCPPGTTQVRFSLSNGLTLMYDYFVNQWGTFNTSVASSTIWNSLHTTINSSFVVYKETPGIYLDGATPVVMSFTTSWLQLAGLRGYQRAYFFFVLGNYLSANQLQCTISYDFNANTTPQVTTFTPVNTVASTTLQERIFLQRQRCRAFQIAVLEIDGSAGAGLTLSGLNIQVGFKKGYAPIPAAQSVGSST